MNVTRCGPLSHEELRSLFADYRFGRYCSDWGLDIDVARRLECDRLACALKEEGAASWAVKDGSGAVGVLQLREAQWDTEFWAKKTVDVRHLVVCGTDAEREDTADALVCAADRYCEETRTQFAVARPDAADLASIRALESHGFRYVETTLVNSRGLSGFEHEDQREAHIRVARLDEADELADMVRDAFVPHRFYADRRFPRERVDEMYRHWVRGNLESDLWTTIVLEVEGRARGLFTYRLEDLTDYFGLRFVKCRMVTLSPEARGCGLGNELFRGAMRFVRDQAEIVDSGLTLRNVRSLNLHNRLGFRVLCTAVTFHKWYE